MFFGGAGFFAVVFWIIILVVNVAFAIAVYKACEAREKEEKKVWFVDRIVWALATLITGALTVLLFWLIHFSTLAKED